MLYRQRQEAEAVLVTLECINQLPLDQELILFLDVKSRDDAIDALVHKLDEKRKLISKEQFKKAILDRERIVSTGVGCGVAIPHAKLKEYPDFFIAVGIQQSEGLEWNALDRAPVHLIFLIGGPDDRQAEYLKILSSLTSLIRDAGIRSQLLQARSPKEIMTLLR